MRDGRPSGPSFLPPSARNWPPPRKAARRPSAAPLSWSSPDRQSISGTPASSRSASPRTSGRRVIHPSRLAQRSIVGRRRNAPGFSSICAIQVMKSMASRLPLVWIQPAEATHRRGQALIDYIERDAANQGVEYWPGSLEDFKTQSTIGSTHRRPKRRPRSGDPRCGAGLRRRRPARHRSAVRFLADTLGVGMRRINVWPRPDQP